MTRRSAMTFPVLLSFFLLFNSSCFNDSKKSAAGTESVTGKKEVIRTYGEKSAGAIIRSYGSCYLKELGCGKKLLHLEGSPYQIGYATGYLMHDEVRKITSMEYFLAVFDDMTGGKLRMLYGIWIEQLAKAFVSYLTDLQLQHVPAEYIAEMKGIADGANDAAPDSAEVAFNDILLLNLANDVLFAYIYRLEQHGLFSSCNGFVVTGRSTAGGRTFLGRHFMYPSAVFYETAMLIEYRPEKGYPFVSVTSPGFVGVTSAMNSKGVAIGMNILHSGDTDSRNTGMGTLLLARKTVQYSGSAEIAVQDIKKSVRGVPWIYVIADCGGNGAVIESTARRFGVRYAGSRFSGQIEDKDDVVAATNHAIIPEIQAVETENAVLSSKRRYSEMTGLILKNYGRIDPGAGCDIIDFLHPGGAHSWYYGTDPDLPVACTVTLYDLKAKELWTLYGKYSDRWVNYRLPY